MTVYTNQFLSTRLMPRLMLALNGVSSVDIAVGFFGSSFSPALEAEIVKSATAAKIRILLGMYFYRGLKAPEFKRIDAINKMLKSSGIQDAGVYIAHKEYHGKIYKFGYENQADDTLILGSSNLSPDGLERRLECNVQFTQDDFRYGSIAQYVDDLFSVKYSYLFDDVDFSRKSQVTKAGLSNCVINMAQFRNDTANITGRFSIQLRPDEQPNSSLNLFFDGGRKNPVTNLYAPRPWYEIELTTRATERKHPFYPKTIPNPSPRTPGGKSRTASFHGYIQFRGKYYKIPMKASGDNGKDIMSAKPAGREALGEFVKGTMEDLNVLARGQRVTGSTLAQAGFDRIVFNKLQNGDYLLEFGSDPTDLKSDRLF